MKKYQIIIPIAIIAGFTLYQLKQFLAMKHPETVLKDVIAQFNQVTGSVIVYEPEKQEKFGQVAHIYRGIINTRDKDFEFTADAYTGEIIDTKEI
ncbi:hypothetical protein [Macrococcoides caseolyticum]|uniref:hypothetical protein n=1 Tax=Macrococcoides caseolyticum TaxID=69966 RepID=UPI001F46B9F8|nr:hypothetical protein [Macrococcus caseolyticus]MCE4956380.1 hypothetical protein [Macrococcus caseolyticus]